MQQHHEFDPFVDQGFLALLLQVNRSTINRYQKIGMPYLAGEKGKNNRYDIGIGIHWSVGHEWAKKRQIRLTSLEKILWATAWGSGDVSFAIWKSRELTTAKRLNSTREEIASAAGFLHGAGLLPWSRA